MAKKRSEGSKLSRSETVTVRLDPRLKLATELAAAKERRTMSSFIEWAVQRAVDEIPVSSKGGKNLTAWDVVEDVWDISEGARFIRLATRYPLLLTFEQQRLHQLITDLVVNDANLQHDRKTDLDFTDVTKHWDLVLSASRHEISIEELRKRIQRKRKE